MINSKYVFVFYPWLCEYKCVIYNKTLILVVPRK